MKGRVTANKLNVRGRPDLSGPKLGVLEKNSIVTILEEIRNWYEIQFNSRFAFIHRDFVEKLKEPKFIKGRINVRLLNIRSAPTTRSTVLGRLVKNAVVDIISEHGDWLEINFNGESAYLHSDFVELLTTEEKLKKGRVIASVLNVRAHPAGSAAKLGTLAKNAPVEIHNQVGVWLEIRFNNNPAFIHGDFVEVGESLPPEAAGAASSNHKYLYQVPELKQVDLQPTTTIDLAGTSKEKKVIKAWNNYGNILKSLCKIKQIEVGTAIAVICVESSGQGFRNNKMIIRFENHQFWKRWGKDNESKFRKHFQFREDKNRWTKHKFREKANGDWQDFHGNQTKEWQVLEFARKLNEKAALDSISMGLPQIMGFNSSAIGYQSVQDMFKNFNSDVRYHLFGLFDFLDKRMILALQENDFEEFAGYYNGTGQAEKYGGWIQDHYDIFMNKIGNV